MKTRVCSSPPPRRHPPITAHGDALPCPAPPHQSVCLLVPCPTFQDGVISARVQLWRPADGRRSPLGRRLHGPRSPAPATINHRYTHQHMARLLHLMTCILAKRWSGMLIISPRIEICFGIDFRPVKYQRLISMT